MLPQILLGLLPDSTNRPRHAGVGDIHGHMTEATHSETSPEGTRGDGPLANEVKQERITQRKKKTPARAHILLGSILESVVFCFGSILANGSVGVHIYLYIYIYFVFLLCSELRQKRETSHRGSPKIGR